MLPLLSAWVCAHCGCAGLPPLLQLQVTKAQLFCVGDGELFEEAGLVVSKDAWRKKEIRSHTKHVYTQRK